MLVEKNILVSCSVDIAPCILEEAAGLFGGVSLSDEITVGGAIVTARATGASLELWLQTSDLASVFTGTISILLGLSASATNH